MSTKRMKVYECDGCGRDVIPGDDGPQGYEGSAVTFRNEHGGTGVKHWFACSEDCITKAILFVIEGSHS